MHHQDMHKLWDKMPSGRFITPDARRRFFLKCPIELDWSNPPLIRYRVMLSYYEPQFEVDLPGLPFIFMMADAP